LRKTTKFTMYSAVIIALVSPCVIASSAVASTVTEASQPVMDAKSPLDPATYAGKLAVATPVGDVMVTVDAGEAPSMIRDIRSAAERGEAGSFGPVLRAGTGCGSMVRSVAGPGIYWVTVDGCAVAGYPGYKREYRWNNRSDVLMCADGRGFTSSGARTWYSASCTYDTATVSVPWGNVLAYTEMQAMSGSGATGAAFEWRA
jgi:hypothetical protein